MMSSIDFNKVGILKDEIEILKTRAEKEGGGMGHFWTTISVLEGRIKEIEEREFNDTLEVTRYLYRNVE